MDPRTADSDFVRPPTSPGQRIRYSPDEAMHLYSAIVGPAVPADQAQQQPSQPPPPSSGQIRKQRRIEQLLTDLDDQRLRELTHYAADRCRREIGKVISRIALWKESRGKRARAGKANVGSSRTASGRAHQ